MLVTEYILNFFAERGVRYVFGIQGGFISPLFDAFHGRTDIQYICTQHEQAAAMAADGYARFNGLGVAIATSGPGATNLITGIGCSWFDSIPVLLITGQVPTGEARGTSKVRQKGFQETDIVSIVRPITKYASHVSHPRNIPYELACAVWKAQEGRPGPVLLDIPMDVQMAELPADCLHFCPPPDAKPEITAQVNEVVTLIANAKRPVVIYGAGARNAQAELLQFIEMTGIPCLPSWAAIDLIPHDHPLFVSQFGVYGSRAGNFTVQNADLIIAIGTRLDGRMTGKGFAPKAVKVVVDLDIHQAMACKPEVMIIADALDFLWAILPRFSSVLAGVGCVTERWGWRAWYDRIAAWKEKYPITAESSDEIIQPLDFLRQLCRLAPDDAIIVADSGANLSWTFQAWSVRGTQRLFSALGYSPMGYAVPAAIGAHYATGKPIIAICGDGSMQMNIQELQTLAHYNIPVKVFILDNFCYGIIQQFQDELYKGRYEATGEAGGYSVPDFMRVATAYKLKAQRIVLPPSIETLINRALALAGPVINDVEIATDARIFPKVCFGNTLENQSPLLPPEEVAENMRNE